MTINEVQFNADLSDILNELQTQLQINNIPLLQKTKDAGGDIMVQCPYHSNGQERKPSAGIRKEDGMFHCFACGETHSLQEVISYCFGHTDDLLGTFGWKWLLKNFVAVENRDRREISLDFGGRISNGTNQKSHNDNKNYVPEEELDKYRYIHPYMYKRGLTDDIIELFDIGYDKETDCITFPIRDITGKCLGVARRSTKGKYFNYPQGFEKPLYGLYELYHGERNPDYIGEGQFQYSFPDEVIVTESMLDALSFWTIGKYAVALNGVGSHYQFKQLRNLPCRAIILCTDMDEAGLKARVKLRRNLTNKVVFEYILPNGRKDANECTKDELRALSEVYVRE